jgi:hypothetical protein
MIIIIIIKFINVPGGYLQREHVKKREIKAHIYKHNTTQHKEILMIINNNINNNSKNTSNSETLCI